MFPIKCTFILIFAICFSKAQIFEFNIILHNLITAIEKVIDYYKNNISNFNIDGIFGLKILEGEIKSALNAMDMDYVKLMRETALIDKMIAGNISFIDRLYHMRLMAHNLSIMACFHLHFNYPDYYDKMKYFVTNEWMPKVRFRTVKDISEPIKPTNNSFFDEDTSDLCLAEIIKYIPNDMSEIDTCKIAKVCLNVLLLAKGLTAYLATHQVLYSTLVQKSNCLFHINDLLRENNTSIEELQNEFCSTIFIENQRLYIRTFSENSYSSTLKINNKKQDLFLEQVFVCGTIGFMDFVNLNFLTTIMSWISQTGCFRFSDRIQKHNITKLGRRHILEEVIMSDGCLAHKTSLGLAVLSTYLRLFFNPYIPETFKKNFNVLNSIKEERLQFQKRNLPKVEQDSMSLYDAYINHKRNIYWKPYFNLNTSILETTVVSSEVENKNYLYFIVIFIIVTLFFCLKKFKKCIRYLIKK